jgi:hypothetical protein
MESEQMYGDKGSARWWIYNSIRVADIKREGDVTIVSFGKSSKKHIAAEELAKKDFVRNCRFKNGTSYGLRYHLKSVKKTNRLVVLEEAGHLALLQRLHILFKNVLWLSWCNSKKLQLQTLSILSCFIKNWLPNADDDVIKSG